MRPANPKSKFQILEIAIPLFAKAGYVGVSMRDIANEVGMSAAALYYHFPDKQQLYLQAMSQAFADKAHVLLDELSLPVPPEEQLLKCLIEFSKLIHKDANFRTLLQREMLDGDESRLNTLAEQVFQDVFIAVSDLCKKLGSQYDAHLLTVSILGLVLYHFEISPIRIYLKGGKKEHNDPQVVANHVFSLLMHGLKGHA